MKYFVVPGFTSLALFLLIVNIHINFIAGSSCMGECNVNNCIVSKIKKMNVDGLKIFVNFTE